MDGKGEELDKVGEKKKPERDWEFFTEGGSGYSILPLGYEGGAGGGKTP